MYKESHRVSATFPSSVPLAQTCHIRIMNTNCATISRCRGQLLKALFNPCPILSWDPNRALTRACYSSLGRRRLDLEDLYKAFVEVQKQDSLDLLLVLQ